jgi:hypothetical protein
MRSFTVAGTGPGERRPFPSTGSVFEHTGATPLSVTGGVTGRRYNFSAAGTRLEVDARDAESLRRIAVLREASLA